MKRKQRQLGDKVIDKINYAAQRGCRHRALEILTEKDACAWVHCLLCGKRGPKKHSITLALLGWIVRVGNQHPRTAK